MKCLTGGTEFRMFVNICCCEINTIPHYIVDREIDERIRKMGDEIENRSDYWMILLFCVSV